MKRVSARLQSGERYEAPDEEKVASILENLHPEYNARVTFCVDDQGSLSAFGCVSDGFALSYQTSTTASVMYCPRMLSISEARMLIGRFIQGAPDWRAGFPWRSSPRAVRIGIAVLVVVVLASILFFLLRDLAGWF